jgi:hypothetical protein
MVTHNDMHVKTMGSSWRKTLTDKVFEMAQDFVRVALRPRPCQKQPPLLLWLDDYIGNEQRIILETTALSKAMHVLANYYGLGSVSYADAVRDWVYGDTHEILFSPAAGTRAGRQFTREIHPGQVAHLSMALDDDLPPADRHQLLQSGSVECSRRSKHVLYNHSKIPGLPGTSGDVNQTCKSRQGKASTQPVSLPPALTNSLNHKAFQGLARCRSWRLLHTRTV